MCFGAETEAVLIISMIFFRSGAVGGWGPWRRRICVEV